MARRFTNFGALAKTTAETARVEFGWKSAEEERICMVCATRIPVAYTQGRVRFVNGRVRWLCSHRCSEQFDQTPELYLVECCEW